MKRTTVSYTTVAASLTGFASNVTGASFVLTANNSADSVAHKVTIRNDSATNHTGKTITLVGTAYNGEALTEVVTGPNNGATVTSSGYFLTLTSATPSATIGADTFDIGWAADAVTPPINCRTRPENTSAAIGISVDVVGSAAYSMQETLGGNWYAHATIVTKTADFVGSTLYPVMAVRAIVTAASGLVINVLQAGE